MVYVITLPDDYERALSARLAWEVQHGPPVDRALRVQELCQEALGPWLLAVLQARQETP